MRSHYVRGKVCEPVDYLTHAHLNLDPKMTGEHNATNQCYTETFKPQITLTRVPHFLLEIQEMKLSATSHSESNSKVCLWGSHKGQGVGWGLRINSKGVPARQPPATWVCVYKCQPAMGGWGLPAGCVCVCVGGCHLQSVLHSVMLHPLSIQVFRLSPHIFSSCEVSTGKRPLIFFSWSPSSNPLTFLKCVFQAHPRAAAAHHPPLPDTVLSEDPRCITFCALGALKCSPDVLLAQKMLPASSASSFHQA